MEILLFYFIPSWICLQFFYNFSIPPLFSLEFTKNCISITLANKVVYFVPNHSKELYLCNSMSSLMCKKKNVLFIKTLDCRFFFFFFLLSFFLYFIMKHVWPLKFDIFSEQKASKSLSHWTKIDWIGQNLLTRYKSKLLPNNKSRVTLSQKTFNNSWTFRVLGWWPFHEIKNSNIIIKHSSREQFNPEKKHMFTWTADTVHYTVLLEHFMYNKHSNHIPGMTFSHPPTWGLFTCGSLQIGNCCYLSVLTTYAQ